MKSVLPNIHRDIDCDPYFLFLCFVLNKKELIQILEEIFPSKRSDYKIRKKDLSLGLARTRKSRITEKTFGPKDRH